MPIKNKQKHLDNEKLDFLKKTAMRVRKESLTMIQNSGSGNPGSALSCVEILIWLLHHQMNIKPNNPTWEKRDRLILSKGQSAPVFYSIVSDFSWIEKKEFKSFRGFNSRLQAHPDYNKLDCVDYPSGSLGQGLSVANGMAMAANVLGKTDIRFFVLIGDGEVQEGQIWESAMTAGHYQLKNIIAIIDRNKFQQDASVKSLMDIEPLKDKWEAFNWEITECDGHSYLDLEKNLQKMQSNKPKLIIANTVKGQGVSFMEGNNYWHTGGKKFTPELLNQCINELK